MNINIKRGLAIAAIAPLAVIATAGAAAAAPERADITNANKFGSQVSVFCEHPDESDLYFRVKVDLEGNGTGSDHGDTDLVRVTSSDNGGQAGYNEPEARTKKIKVSMIRDGETIASVTRSDSDVQNDGNRRFSIDKENVDLVRVQVWWTYDSDAESAYCLFRLPNTFQTNSIGDFDV